MSHFAKTALSVLLLLHGCGAPPQGDRLDPAPRGSGKADTTGSCQGICGAATAAPGGCWCDEMCSSYGDCCQDKAALCDGAAPTAPAASDPGFTVQGARKWYLIGNDLTGGDDLLTLTVTAPLQTQHVDAWLDNAAPVRLTRSGATYTLLANIETLPAGQHRLLLSADGSSTAFAQVDFQRSHPLYVVVSNDWDDPDNPDVTLTRQELLHARHPELKLTHFVGPYTFTDSTVSAARAQQLVAWLKQMEASHGDEIGLHIHPYCSFVQTTSVPCRTQPSFYSSQGDTTGYTVILSSYTTDETATLLQAAKNIFASHGLGTPTSFRAGGWTAQEHTLQALADAGFVADTSGCNWKRLEEWKGYGTSTLYAYNEQNWPSIGDTSQPYYPAASILEVPDNGLLVDYVTAQEMIDIFAANWSGTALGEPRVYSVGYHPPNFSEAYLKRMDEALKHVDQYLHSSDGGPAVYATLSGLVRVWPGP